MPIENFAVNNKNTKTEKSIKEYSYSTKVNIPSVKESSSDYKGSNNKPKEIHRPTTISITQSLNTSYNVGGSKIGNVHSHQVLGNDPFTENDVKKAMQKISNRKEINPAMKVSFTMYNPEINGNKVVLPVENTYQYDEIKGYKSLVINNLSQLLNNKNIDFDLRVLKEVERKKLRYTTKDKLEYLIEKNPIVKDLVNDLQVDF